MEEKITIEQLKKPEFLVSAKSQLADMLNYDSGREALDFVYDLERVFRKNPGFKTSSPDMYNEYQDIIIKAKLVALKFLKDEEIIDVLKDHLSIMLLSFPPVTNDIVDKLSSHMAAIPLFSERDILKGKIMRILLESQEIITTNNIKDEKGAEQLPTIANWIKSYLRDTQDTDDESLKLILYVHNSRSTMNLTDKERETLKMLLSLYEYLRKSSTTLEGLEESLLINEGGTLKILSHGQLEEVA